MSSYLIITIIIGIFIFKNKDINNEGFVWITLLWPIMLLALLVEFLNDIFNRFKYAKLPASLDDWLTKVRK